MLDYQEIQNILPHRYPFLLVDRITELDPGKSAVGIKQVSGNEIFFQGHFPGRPVFPGVLQVEALAQVGGIALLALPENKGKIPVFAGLDKVRFRGLVKPGDTLVLSARITRQRGDFGFGQARAQVDGKTVCEANLMFALMEFED